MAKATKSETQARLNKEKAERDAKMAKQKADRLAAEGKKDDELEQHAKRVAALYKSMRELEARAEEKAGFELKKAAEKRAALEQALVEARELCKAAGEDFKTFQEKYAPSYKRTRLYQVLAIADGRKTVEGIREEEREKKRKQRAGKVSGTSVVPDDSSAPPADARKPKTEAPAAPPVEQAEPAKTTGSKKSSAEPAPVEPTESEMVILTTGSLAGLAVVAPDPQEFIDQYGAEIAERYARSMLAKLGVDAPDASRARSEAPKSKALKPGVPLPWDDCAPMKEDGGYRRGSADTSIKSGYRISPAWKDDKPYGHEVERLKFGSKVAAVTVKSGDFTYDEAKAIAQADFDAGGK